MISTKPIQKDFKEAAITLCGYGLGVVPCGADKLPVVEWESCKTQALTVEEIEALFNGGTIRPDYVNKSGNKGVRMFKACTAIAVAGGAVSGGLEIVDVDSKYDKTGTLHADLMEDIKRVLPEVHRRLVVIKTQSGGYHIPYRAPNIEGNKKLALRQVLSDERDEYYEELVKSGNPQDKAREEADKWKTLVLLETRGEGGYVLAPPSPRYTYIQGDYSTIPVLTAAERDDLINIARAYNQVPEIVTPPKAAASTFNPPPSGAVSPFDDYNKRGDVVDLLMAHKWRHVYTSGERVILLRPGISTSKTSGNYHTGLRLFTAWSSNAEPFEPGKAYNPSSVFIILECNGDTKEAYHKLRALGYGTPPPTGGKALTLTKVQVDAVHRGDKTARVIAEPGGTLTHKDITTTHTEEDVVITSPGVHAAEEVESVINEVMGKHPRVYVVEDGVEEAACIYKLNNILRRYDAIQDDNGGVLSDRDVHAFMDEVVSVAELLEPMHRDMYRTAFLTHPGVATLGITQEAYTSTEERLRYQAAKHKQAVATRDLMQKVEAKIATGNTSAAVELIKREVDGLAMHTRVDEFESRMQPLTREAITEAFKKRPESIPSGYQCNGEDIMIPAASVSYYCGPTGHGKTSMLINTMLYMAELSQCAGQVFHYITYEMDLTSIYGNILNPYLADDVARDNYEAIVDYYKNGSMEKIYPAMRDYFKAREERFMEEMILSGRIRIHHIDDNSTKLCDFITHLHHKHGNIGAVFIDYMQLITPGGDGDTDKARHEQIKGMSKDLMRAAIDTGLPIITAAQFNRDAHNHNEVLLKNISEGSDVEKSGALVLGLWNNNKEPVATKDELKRIKESGIYKPGTLYIKVMKARWQRDGVWSLHGWNGNARSITMAPPSPPEPKKEPKRDAMIYG